MIVISFDMATINANSANAYAGDTYEQTLTIDYTPLPMHVFRAYPTATEPGLLYSITTANMILKDSTSVTHVQWPYSVIGYLGDNSCDTDILNWSSQFLTA